MNGLILILALSPLLADLSPVAVARPMPIKKTSKQQYVRNQAIAFPTFGTPQVQRDIQSASVMILNQVNEEGGFAGSGTVIAVRDDACNVAGWKPGLIVTAAHVLTNNKNDMQIVFSDDRQVPAKLVARDMVNDLALLLSYVPATIKPAPVTDERPDKKTPLLVFGFGGGEPTPVPCVFSSITSAAHDGGLVKTVPAADGHRYRTGDNQMQMQGVTDKGHSGAGVFDVAGNLRGVQWGGTDTSTFATDAKTLSKFIVTATTLPWARDPRYRGRPRFVPSPTTTPPADDDEMTMPEKPTEKPVERPVEDDIPPPEIKKPPVKPKPPRVEIPTADASHAEIKRLLLELGDQLRKVQDDAVSRNDLANVKTNIDEQKLVALMVSQLATKSDLKNHQPVVDNTKLIARLDEMLTMLKAGKTAEIAITVDQSQQFSPTYLDVSLIWALQQAVGIDQATLVINSESADWPKLREEYQKTKQKFCSLSLLDIRGKNIAITALPQLVVYTAGNAKPVILKGEQAVIQKLQEIYRQAGL